MIDDVYCQGKDELCEEKAKIYHILIGLGLWCLTPLLKIPF